MFTLTWKRLQTNKNYKEHIKNDEKIGAPKPPLRLVSGITTADHKELGLRGSPCYKTVFLVDCSKVYRSNDL